MRVDVVLKVSIYYILLLSLFDQPQTTVAMSPYDRSLNAIIIGAGPAGIAMAYRLRHDLGFEDFTVYEKLDGVGGTWRTNTYPGW